jgi:uncharacterized protein (TIGR00369 family)
MGQLSLSPNFPSFDIELAERFSYFMTNIRSRLEASFNAQGLMSTLGAQLVRVEDGEVHILLPFHQGLTQQHGYTHAGAITSVVDNACGYAALTKAPEDHEVLTVEFKVNFVRPAIGEQFLAIGRVQTSGKLISVCTGEVLAEVDGGNKIVAIMQATMMYVRRNG